MVIKHIPLMNHQGLNNSPNILNHEATQPSLQSAGLLAVGGSSPPKPTMVIKHIPLMNHQGLNNSPNILNHEATQPSLQSAGLLAVGGSSPPKPTMVIKHIPLMNHQGLNNSPNILNHEATQPSLQSAGLLAVGGSSPPGPTTGPTMVISLREETCQWQVLATSVLFRKVLTEIFEGARKTQDCSRSKVRVLRGPPTHVSTFKICVRL